MSVWLLWQVLVILYSDNFAINGPKQEAWRVHHLLYKNFTFSRKNKTPLLSGYVGIRRLSLGKDEYGAFRYKLHQTEYTRSSPILPDPRHRSETLRFHLRRHSGPSRLNRR